MSVENAVCVKFPHCWVAELQIWLAQAEAQFTLRKIVLDDTKYYYTLSGLDQTTAS